DIHCNIGDGTDRINCLLKKTARYADNIARQNHVENLPFAVAQQLVAHGVAFPHEAELAELVSVNDEVPPPAHEQLAIDDRLQASQIKGAQIDGLQEPRDERVLLQRGGGRGKAHAAEASPLR